MAEAENSKILVIDDNLEILTLLSQFLELEGYKSITCPSAKEGLAQAENKEIKLILLDIDMPEMNGVEVLAKLRKLVPNTSIIMITGMDDVKRAEKCMSLGAYDYITKPFDFDYLRTSILSQLLSFS